MFHVSDAGIAVLILFVYNLLRLLSSISPSQPLLSMTEGCLKSQYSVCKMIGLIDDQFLEYVVCQQCHSIYELSQCIQQDYRGRKTSKRYWYTKFPNHPFQSQRQKCGCLLLEGIQTHTGNII